MSLDPSTQPSGPELDAKVAAHVRGWPQLRFAELVKLDPTDPPITAPRFSEHMGAAWFLWDAFAARARPGDAWSLTRKGDEWVVSVHRKEAAQPEVVARAGSMPLAVCRAVLASAAR